ncbi:hypothetical protein [Caminibacter sp.]
MGMRINLNLKDENGELKLIYSLLENKAQAVEDALKLAVKNPEWRKKHLIRVDKEKLEQILGIIVSDNRTKNDKES